MTIQCFPNVISNSGQSSRRTQGKVVIITGCNSPLGIGRASAHQFANNGAKAIFICDLFTDHLETHKRELNSLYPKVDIHTKKVDAGDEKDVAAVVDDALKLYGRVDVFFANAGVSISYASVLEGVPEDFMETMRVNALRYVMRCSCIIGDVLTVI